MLAKLHAQWPMAAKKKSHKALRQQAGDAIRSGGEHADVLPPHHKFVAKAHEIVRRK